MELCKDLQILLYVIHSQLNQNTVIRVKGSLPQFLAVCFAKSFKARQNLRLVLIGRVKELTNTHRNLRTVLLTNSHHITILRVDRSEVLNLLNEAIGNLNGLELTINDTGNRTLISYFKLREFHLKHLSKIKKELPITK